MSNSPNRNHIAQAPARVDIDELARSLLSEMVPERRIRFCALVMIDIESGGDDVLQALLDARNVITARAKDLIAAPSWGKRDAQ